MAVSILDYDQELYIGPSYQGNFLESLLLPRREWRNEGVLLAHVHSVFMEIASKAFVYFHVMCIGSGMPSVSGCLEGESIQAMCSRKRAQKLAFMRQNDILLSDVSIVEYLADVVKSQHQAQHRATCSDALADGLASVSTIRLDHSTCTRFTNTKGPLSPPMADA